MKMHRFMHCERISVVIRSIGTRTQPAARSSTGAPIGIRATSSANASASGSRRPVIDVLRHMRCGILAAQIVDEVGGVVTPISAHRRGGSRKPRDHVHGRLAFPSAAGRGQFVIHDQAVAVLHENVALVAELYALAPALAVPSPSRRHVAKHRLLPAVFPAHRCSAFYQNTTPMIANGGGFSTAC